MWSCRWRAIWTRKFGFYVEHCVRFNLNKSVMKLNDTQFDTGKLIFLFKSLPTDKNTFPKPIIISTIVQWYFRLHFAFMSNQTATIKLHHMFRSKSKLQVWSNGAETVYGLSGNHLHYSVANLFRLTRAKFYTNRFGFEEDMAKNILVCCLWNTVYIYIYTPWGEKNSPLLLS